MECWYYTRHLNKHCTRADSSNLYYSLLRWTWLLSMQKTTAQRLITCQGTKGRAKRLAGVTESQRWLSFWPKWKKNYDTIFRDQNGKKKQWPCWVLPQMLCLWNGWGFPWGGVHHVAGGSRQEPEQKVSLERLMGKRSEERRQAGMVARGSQERRRRGGEKRVRERTWAQSRTSINN